MIQSKNDQFDWKRQQGNMGAGKLGPRSAAKGNYYIITEASSHHIENNWAVSVPNVLLSYSLKKFNKPN